MIKMSWDDKFNLRISCDLQFPLEPGPKLEILSGFSVLYHRFEQFSKWYNDPDVPGKDKDPFNLHAANARNGLNYAYQFMKNCGLTDLEIKEFTEIPF